MSKRIKALSLLVFVILLTTIMCSCNSAIKEISLSVDYEDVEKEVPFGTNFSLSGLKVLARLSNKSYRIVKKGGEDGYSVDDGGYDREKPGEYTITISYKEFDAVEFVITVLEEVIIDESKQTDVTLVGIKIREFEGKRIFHLGEEFSADGIVVEEVYSDDSRRKIAIQQLDIDYSQYEPNKIGNYEIIIKYYINFNMSDTYTVTVISPTAPLLIDLIVRTNNAKTQYLYGEEFMLDGLIVEKKYENSDGTIELVVAEREELEIDSTSFYNQIGVDALGWWEIIVHLIDTDMQKTYDVEIINFIESIDLEIKNDKIYSIGEEFNESDFVIIVNMGAGNSYTVEGEGLTSYNFDCSNFDSSQAGDYEIRVTHNDYEDIFADITVTVGI